LAQTPLLSHGEQIGPGLTPALLESTALAAFDGLFAGERLKVLSESPLGGVLARLQIERKGEFEWTPTAEGPGIFGVEVLRRKAPRGSLRTVHDALSWDHDRLDALEDGAFAAHNRGEASEAQVLYSAFAFGLRRHIRFEEEILFPEFEIWAGDSTMGPTAVMRQEHQEILSLLARLEGAWKEAPTQVESFRQSLRALLADHNLKEEEIVYPVTDRVLSAGQRDALVGRIQSA